MEIESEENPWKNKSHVKAIAALDIVVAFIGIAHSTYYMCYLYFHQDKDQMNEIFSHLPFLIFLWTANLLFYSWQIAVAALLYASVNQEAMDTDPYITIQKCNCWLRTSKVIMMVVVLKLCIVPGMVWLNLSYDYTVIVGIIQLVFRFVGVLGVKSFVQDLQT